MKLETGRQKLLDRCIGVSALAVSVICGADLYSDGQVWHLTFENQGANRQERQGAFPGPPEWPLILHTDHNVYNIYTHVAAPNIQ